MRKWGIVLAILLLFSGCGHEVSEPSLSTITIMRPSSTTELTTVETSANSTEDPVDTTIASQSTESVQTTDTVHTTTTTSKSIKTTKKPITTTTKSIKKTTTSTTIMTSVTSTTTRTSIKTTVVSAPSTTTESTTEKTEITETTTTAVTTTTTEPSTTKPSISGEVRGAWISYIELADVLQRCSTPTQARTALDVMMQQLADNRINTVFFHVRANSDAYYKSKVFQPAFSAKALLTAGFDPLEYAVQAAHTRGMELHAWINPYRIGNKADYAVSGVPTLTDQNGRLYYVPTSSKAQALILRGVREILENYDVDGIQYDDYFYPEGLLEENTVYGFESGDYEAYCRSGGTLSVGDWRRAGVDALISGTHVLTSSSGVVFGVSPAVNADNTYRALYADCRKWLAQEGFVDYLCPQIYTGFEHGVSPFDTMVNTWKAYPRHNSVDLYVGLALYKIGLRSDNYAGGGKTEWRNHDDVMKRSVEYLRDQKVKGICLYSYSCLYPQDCLIPEFSKTNDVSVAKNEIRNLLSVW